MMVVAMMVAMATVMTMTKQQLIQHNKVVMITMTMMEMTMMK